MGHPPCSVAVMWRTLVSLSKEGNSHAKARPGPIRKGDREAKLPEHRLRRIPYCKRSSSLEASIRTGRGMRASADGLKRDLRPGDAEALRDRNDDWSGRPPLRGEFALSRRLVKQSGIQRKTLRHTYKPSSAPRTSPSEEERTSRKGEFLTLCNLVEPMGVEPTASRVRF
jgi:hypothetical protein